MREINIHFIHFLIIKNETVQFTMSCFRCGKQSDLLYIYIHLLFLFFSHIGYYKVLSIVPCAINQGLAAVIYIYVEVFL